MRTRALQGFILMSLFMMLLIAGCGGSSGQFHVGGVTAKAGWVDANGTPASLPAEVVTVRMTISGPGLITLQKDFPASGDGAATITVPAGMGLTVTLSGLSASGTVVSEGKVGNVAVQGGAVTDVGVITLAPVPGGQYTITGSVTTISGTPLAGVTVFLTGETSFTTQTDENGNFTFVVPDGSYVVSAGIPGYVISSSQVVVVSGTKVTGVRFSATVATSGTYYISGSVTIEGKGLAGVTVSLGGSNSATTQTDAGGNFTFTVGNGPYTLSAAKAGYTISGTQPVAVNGADVTGVAFTAAEADYALSGRVTDGGSPLSGATVTLAGSNSQTAVTDAEGKYAFHVHNGSYTVSASKDGYTFSSSWAVTVNGGDLGGVDFAATRSGYSISGRVTMNGDGIGGVTVATAGGSATTDLSGYYTIGGLQRGSYSVTPSRNGFAFTPIVRSATIDASDVTGVDFATVNTGSIVITW